MEWTDTATWKEQATAALQNRGPLRDALRWNAGAYLWFAGMAETLAKGIDQAETTLSSGDVVAQLNKLRTWHNGLSIR